MPVSIKRIFVEKRPGFDIEARRLREDIAGFLGSQYPSLARLEKLRIFNWYELAADLTEEQLGQAVSLVFSEPQSGRVFYDLPQWNCREPEVSSRRIWFGVEYLPGQYDQRADSAGQCLELVLGIRPRIRCAKFYLFSSELPLGSAETAALKAYLINPVDSREALLHGVDLPPCGGSLWDGAFPRDEDGADTAEVPVLSGFTSMDREGLAGVAKTLGFAMSLPDLICCRDYFAGEKRDPALTELRVLDTYWSDHCRHTTFTTILESITVEDSGDEYNIRRNRALQKALALYEEARREVYGGGPGGTCTLMDMAVIGAKVLKKRGLLTGLDESAEVNACTIKVNARFAFGGAGPGGSGTKAESTGPVVEEPWLLLFKNETHNHPTEIEPFGGAATCLGGAIRDPLSGRAYVYQAMRISGGGDPRRPLGETLPGKLPQIKIARESAAGYSSYGNQIGLATGQVAELYHPGYLAKHLELGAVIGAVPQTQVRRAEPEPGDPVILVGGKTGRDGIGGATGSSKAHTGESVESAGAEVQKGNAVEERKLQRFFRDPQTAVLIKRCNDFGAGGVAVAVGELAPGLEINLDALPKKYAGLDGTELAISESQERIALVCAPGDAERLIHRAGAENLDAVVIARVSAGSGGTSPEARLRMNWRGRIIVDLARDFLDSHGALRSVRVVIPSVKGFRHSGKAGQNPSILLDQLKDELNSLRGGSRRGLQERFDGSIGAASVLFPWGGEEQGTPECGMAALLPILPRSTPADPEPAAGVPESLTASIMTFGFDPALTGEDPYTGAKGAVKEALAKYACLGGDPFKAWLSMQEYFERMENPQSWGKAAAALLGVLEAQLALGVPAIGGKDSMSGSYRDPARGVDLAVPPTVVVFAAGTAAAAAVRSGALGAVPGNTVILLYGGSEAGDNGGADEWAVFRANLEALAFLASRNLVRAAYPAGPGGAGTALALMAFGNMTGLEVCAGCLSLVNEKTYPGAVLLELDGEGLARYGGLAALFAEEGVKGAVWAEAARTLEEKVFRITGDPWSGGSSQGEEPAAAELPLDELRRAYEEPLLQVYPQVTAEKVSAPHRSDLEAAAGAFAGRGRSRRSAGMGIGRPLVILPVFPGTNCEWDMEKAFLEAGARTRQVVFRNRSAADIAASLRELASAIAGAQILALSGGFSAGDEPDGSGKFIANVFRASAMTAAVTEFIETRQGLILGICNGFQALIKLGLVPWGRYTIASEDAPTLTFNRIGRHVSRMARTLVLPSPSPWLALEEPGTVHILPVSHGEGRLVIREETAAALFRAGQVPFCYADAAGGLALSEPDNPNGSDYAIEALTSPDGRILGKMGHSERRGRFVHTNIPGNKVQRIFEAGVRYFR
ncbi:MAG: phosphoribosylformylglycinamidine synthase [Treponema sp.]|jgi:phosphoribosylformylglycinamidine synthase|nr:phosphoribosylformylglycinamidine synthase [Treponema sp.]